MHAICNREVAGSTPVTGWSAMDIPSRGADCLNQIVQMEARTMNYKLSNLPDHPDIASALQYGYPSWAQPKEYHCELCGDPLYFDEIYEDFNHDFLCECCLLKLHRKSPWE